MLAAYVSVLMRERSPTDTAYTLLPFSNTLFEIEMYGSEIKQVLEDAI